MSRVKSWLLRLLGATGKESNPTSEPTVPAESSPTVQRTIQFSYEPLKQETLAPWTELPGTGPTETPLSSYSYEQLERLSRDLSLQSRRGTPWGEQGWPL